MSKANVTAAENLTEALEADLVLRAQAHDELAVREIVRRYNQRLFRAARSIVRNDTEAEDVVQAGYVQAFTHLSAFRGEAQFGTWLTRIVINEALGRVRRRRPTTGIEQIEAEQGSSAQIIQFPLLQNHPDPETAMSRQEIRELIEQAVDALPEAFRLVFVLRDVEGLSAEETAAQLDIRPETVNTRLFRARRLLRAAIEDRLTSAVGALFPFDGERCIHMADRVVADLARRGNLAT
ncbi:MAG TPA: RNA polymerase sigma factor [Devosia sp.]|nr:RNA polymerase sigma factor [Devosia sp.]